jgi:hypothetical protein
MKKFYLFFAFLLFSISVTCAQDSAFIIRSFNQYYKKSIDKLRDLYGMRGAGFVCETDGYRDVNYLSIVNSFTQEYLSLSNKTGILFYSHDADTLRIWLYKNNLLHFILPGRCKKPM